MKRTTAPNSAAGQHVDKIPGSVVGTTGIAEDRNNLQEEICSVIEGLGIALNGADWMQLEKAIIANSHVVGEILDVPYKLTPVGLAAARSKTYPAYPRYCPVVRIDDADHDVTAASASLFVAAMRAHKADSGGTTDHSVTVAAHVVTGSGTAWDNLLSALAEEQLVNEGLHPGAGYTAWRCLNVGGTDYEITAVTPASHTITITGDSLSGAQTAIWYPYRIAGDTTSARVFRDSGRALVSDDGVENIGGARRRDRMQGHRHSPLSSYIWGAGAIEAASGAGSTRGNQSSTGDPVTDTVNGVPRVGLTTAPRSNTVFRYYWLGYLA